MGYVGRPQCAPGDVLHLEGWIVSLTNSVHGNASVKSLTISARSLERIRFDGTSLNPLLSKWMVAEGALEPELIGAFSSRRFDANHAATGSGYY